MTRRIFCKVLLVVVAIFGVMVLSGVLLAQGRSEDAFERVREVQERNTERLMAMDGVEGTAIGYNQNDQLAVKVFTAGPGVRGIPQELEGVPVHVVVTGKIYALKPPANKPNKPGKPPKDRTPPAAPTDLTAEPVSSSAIKLNWADNIDDSDLDYYNVYCATTSGGPYSRIASNVELSEYIDSGLSPDTTFYYVVTAVDTSRNESDNSNEALATTDAGPVEPPIGPRPAPIGVSTGHPNITAGTIGCRVKKNGNVYALSNNHVYADENKASIGDNVLQPGPYDGGLDPRDAIGTLAEFEPINFHPRASNTIDAAIALTNIDMVGNATPDGGYGTPSSETTGAVIGLGVQKYGRTTGLTTGEITAINATVRVGYDSGTARFINQIIIEPGGFSKGGDSGSLIVTQEGKMPVGLLFAGSDLVTIANPIDEVLSRFGVTVDGK
ncbi:MAG TPA: fibronectin type III domain-containing protein [Sedimentisphaerales bacterium]|nr:fibronectin type III domain-containing protein [Sedimentisphaerales bacterium]